jgi:NADPH:quinone reductase-like Zn-dependent oxidoreductase
MGEMPELFLRDGEVLVKAHAAGVNLLDSKIRDGEFKLNRLATDGEIEIGFWETALQAPLNFRGLVKE